jgi:molybdopterin-containing oxidoreductase family iron-sulfur binding subunit
MGDRREFLKIAGLGVLGLAGKPELSSAQEEHGTPAVSGKALTANRWAMVIDLNKCREEKGCTDCISACHEEHNVPHFDNPKDEIKWIWKDEFHTAFHDLAGEHIREDLEHTPTLLLCNHCDNPPCVRVCPTQATWKREQDGIVMMDWHRCIGCRYCVVACPYGSRSFNWRDPRPAIDEINPNFPTRCRGVVEKCTFCEHRLAKGEAPACVEACPVDAITFGDLEDADGQVRHLLAEHFTIRRRPALGTQPQVYYIV